MLGIALKDQERSIVEEFFQLFKTPWEEYRKSGLYSAVIASSPHRLSEIPRLAIIFGYQPTERDLAMGIQTGPAL
ncbi:MAG TPA: hypothetical protein DCO75_03040, partial [Fibrobacteres bacterium]|nr:hypothetical protein [Fibrobacterota bacterium]